MKNIQRRTNIKTRLILVYLFNLTNRISSSQFGTLDAESVACDSLMNMFEGNHLNNACRFVIKIIIRGFPFPHCFKILLGKTEPVILRVLLLFITSYVTRYGYTIRISQPANNTYLWVNRKLNEFSIYSITLPCSAFRVEHFLSLRKLKTENGLHFFLQHYNLITR